jgi:putative membrane-bound dehydrogenase-like protein
MHCRIAAIVCTFLLGLSLPAWPADEVKSPLSPADAQQLFQLADDSLRIELAAAEPEVVDPVAIRFDEDGRMWVAEMRDYPLGPPKSKEGGGGEPLSKIRVLTDRDGDGRFETATTFADKLPFVNGLQPWKGGVFVTLAGRVAYMKDSDGDGKMDLDETWFEGFAQENSQLRANHPRLALNNHIYVANGLRGGKVVNRRLADQPVINISGMDFRFDPLTGKAEAVSGNGQFGLCFDDWGNRFTCTNRNPCRHVVIEDRYLRASSGVTVPAVMHDVAAFAESSRIFPISRAWTTSNLHAGTFTAACGVYIYRGDLLPTEFKGNVFTCDPTGNLIHREIMQPAGPTFTSKPAYEGKEFLASPDEWFRPVNMELGPDGALYVVDMYRCVIEHPDFVPDELKNRPDQRLGDDRGRIWRIVPKVRPAGPAGLEPAPRRTSQKLSTATIADLVKLLEHPNAWQRETAQRLLVECGAPNEVETMRAIVVSDASPRTRMHALAALSAFSTKGEPSIALLKSVLLADSPGLQRFALTVAERTDRSDEVEKFIEGQMQDRDAGVRFQSYLSAASLQISAKQSLQGADQRDPWLRSALAIGLDPTRAGLLQSYAIESGFRSPRPTEPPDPTYVELLSELAVRGANRDAARAVAHATTYSLAKSGEVEVRFAALNGVLRGLARERIPVGDAWLSDELADLREWLVQKTGDPELALRLRQSALAVFGMLPDSATDIAAFARRENDQTIRTAAIAALARQPGAEHWQSLLDGFASDTPAARRAILEGMLANADRTKLLLDAIDAGRIKPSELDPLQAKRMLESRDAAIKERAGKLFAAATPEDRVKALADYQPAISLAADATRGRAIFEKNCAACHKIGDVGVNVAPDISDSRTKTAAQLLADILQPNRAIDNNYLGYTVRLLDGTIATGILTTETATSITLRQQGGKELVVARSEIDELRSSGVSLMPEGLERQIPQQEMADLLSFIKNWRYLDGRTPVGGK